MKLVKHIISDYKNNENLKGRIIVCCFTFASYFRNKATNKILLIMVAPIIIFYKFITDIILDCEIPVSTKIGRGLVIHHGRAMVLNKNVIIGDNVTLKHNTTLGNKESVEGKDLGSPIIKNNVIIGPHSIIIGPIEIGENSIIGAGSVVVKSIPANSIAAGNPARVIKKILPQ